MSHPIDLPEAIMALLAPDQVITDPAECIPYEIDSALERGAPDAVVFPRSTADVSRIARWASDNHVPLVGRGAGTGRSGGAVPEQGGIVVEFSQMNRLVEFDPDTRHVIVEPGMVNLMLDDLARTKGLYYPPDPSSGRAATLGGNVAENAGGPHCFKYGVTVKYTTRVELVLADGRVVSLGGQALDAPEYDLCGLVTGSEGTLGLITKITARLLRYPLGMQTMMAAFDSVADAGHAVSAVIAAGLVPATLEMMDQKIMRLIEQYVHCGLPVQAGAMLIAEVDGYPAGIKPQIDEITRILKQHGAHDLRIANTTEERNAIWYGRKSAGGAFPHYTVDSTVPRSRIAETLQAANEICERHGLTVGHVFHAGDGNLHPSIMVESANPEQVARVMQASEEILAEVVARNGTISGEHGIGIEKRECMPLMFNAAELAAFWDVKQVFDPTNIMNPGKVFPAHIPPVEIPAPAGTVPVDSFAPATAEEAARDFVALSALKRRVLINVQAPGAVTLDTKALHGILEYAPDDLYITVGAGTRLDEVQDFLASRGRQVALASPWPEATIGGLISANVNSPQRMLYGSLRDQLLAATVVLPDGRILKTGRPVVKNVAGYDLPKVLIGSYGTLGLIVDATLKLYPRARSQSTILIPVNDLERGLVLSTALLAQALVASAIVLYKGPQTPEMPSSRYVLAYTAEGVAEEVHAEMEQVRAIVQRAGLDAFTPTAALSGTDLWVKLLSNSGQGTVQMRLGVAPQQLVTFLREQADALNAGDFLVDIAAGLVYASRDQLGLEQAQAWVEALRSSALDKGGYAIVMTQPEAWSSTIDRWGYHPESLDLMRGLKQRWDLAGILGTGTFVV